jgi:hypothetical protein
LGETLIPGVAEGAFIEEGKSKARSDAEPNGKRG